MPASSGAVAPAANPRDVRFVTQLSVLRAVLVLPMMGLVLASPGSGAVRVTAAVVFAVAAVTDLLDGKLARRWGATTKLGAFLDTTADKLLTAGAMIALLAIGHTNAWFTAIIVGRELVILGLRAIAATEGLVIEASIWGKLKTNVQFVAILLAIVRPGGPVAGLHLDEWVMLAAVVVTVLSGGQYLVAFLSNITSEGAA